MALTLWHLNADDSDNISSFFNFFGLTLSATTLAHLGMLSSVKTLCVTHIRWRDDKQIAHK